jgi:hypothetical protein
MTRHPLFALALAVPLLAPTPSAAETLAATPSAAIASTPVSATCGPHAPRHATARRKVARTVVVDHIERPSQTLSISLWQWPALPLANERCSGPIDGQELRDDQCELRRNATLLWNMGQRPAAVALLCEQPGMHAALEHAGAVCSETPGVQAEVGLVNAGSQATR